MTFLLAPPRSPPRPDSDSMHLNKDLPAGQQPVITCTLSPMPGLVKFLAAASQVICSLVVSLSRRCVLRPWPWLWFWLWLCSTLLYSALSVNIEHVTYYYFSCAADRLLVTD